MSYAEVCCLGILKWTSFISFFPIVCNEKNGQRWIVLQERDTKCFHEQFSPWNWVNIQIQCGKPWIQTDYSCHPLWRTELQTFQRHLSSLQGVSFWYWKHNFWWNITLTSKYTESQKTNLVETYCKRINEGDQEYNKSKHNSSHKVLETDAVPHTVRWLIYFHYECIV